MLLKVAHVSKQTYRLGTILQAANPDPEHCDFLPAGGERRCSEEACLTAIHVSNFQQSVSGECVNEGGKERNSDYLACETLCPVSKEFS